MVNITKNVILLKLGNINNNGNQNIIITGTTSIAPTIKISYEVPETVTTIRRSKVTKRISMNTGKIRASTERAEVIDHRSRHYDESRNERGKQNHRIEQQEKPNETNPTKTRTPKSDKPKGMNKDQGSAQSASKATGKAKDSSLRTNPPIQRSLSQ